MTRTTKTRTTVLAAATVVLGLTLTACGGSDGSGTKDEGAGATSSPTATAQTGTSDTGNGATQAGAGKNSTGTSTGTGTSKGSGKGTGTSAGKQSGGTTNASAPECKVGSLSYTLTRRFPEQQGDHLLITAVNKSGSACTVQKFPVVTPGEANGDVPLSKKDEQPAQPILVKPGGTVYSALPVFQETKAEDDYFTSIRLSLYMNNSDDSAASVTLKTPGEVEYAGKRADGIEVLSWNTKKPYDF
ncbi:DUF4232 domain-containing protein [Streptomyces sp. NPDC050085]|uniref:DUF4232 domain-containing protein n=1 Tax=Streptomyces sp. NPDC050085 TaxID=3365600 RepID=UPI0037AC0A3A